MFIAMVVDEEINKELIKELDEELDVELLNIKSGQMVLPPPSVGATPV